VIGIQEIYRPQAETLAVELGMGMVMGVVRDGGPLGPYGNVILSRLPMVGSQPFDLSHRGREPRGGVRADLALGEGVLRFFNVHFGLRFGERAAQVGRLVAEHAVLDAAAGPRIVVGDLNEWFPAAVGRALRREFHGWRFHRTHPSPAPLFALDRIYWDAGLPGARVHVHRSALARIASDHLPIVGRFRVTPRLAPHLPAAAGAPAPDPLRLPR
jgi:endonuclease/exonuclease/phosphatase family metal-dependent hydrolase